MSNEKCNLLGILEALTKIKKYSKDFNNADEFFKHTLNFDAVLMNFVVIGEFIDRLSDKFKNKNNNIDWIKIKGFRNIIAHDYFGIDAEEVWQIINVDLKFLEKDISALLNF